MFRITRHSLVAIACLGFLPPLPGNPDHPVPRVQLSPEGRALLAAPKDFQVSQEGKLLLVAPPLSLSPDGKALVRTKSRN